MDDDENYWNDVTRSRLEMTPERIQSCREWIARNRANLDQKKKEFEDKYPMAHPRLNQLRLESLDVREFWIDIHQWELEEILKTIMEEEDNEEEVP